MLKYEKCKYIKSLQNTKKKRAEQFGDILEKLYPDAECSLEYSGDPFKLLVMARLSAQCTDKRVNTVSKELFARYKNVYEMAEADIEELERLVHSCGVYKVKAKNIKDMSKIIAEKYNGQIPSDKKALLALPGVGEKIANLILGDLFGNPHIVADTHCIRIAGRLGLTDSDNPKKVVTDLSKLIKKEEQGKFCHRIVLFGREYCLARNPDCENCPVKNTALRKDDSNE